MTAAPELSLITVTWNHRDEIGEFLAALESVRAAGSPRFELLLVDNASADGTAAFVAERWPWVRVIANATNEGFARGCTIGLEQARGEFLMLINPDAFATAEALTGMIAFLKATPKAGAVGCTLLHDDGRPQMSHYPPIGAFTYLGYSSILYPLFERARKLTMAAGLLRVKEPTRCGWLMGSCVMVPRAVFNQVGGLDASYFMYAEDADWCERIRRAGFAVWFLPQFTMRHRQKGSSRRAPEFTFRRVYRSVVHYGNLNLAPGPRARLRGMMLADMALRIPVYALLSLIKPERRARLESVRRLIAIVRSGNPDLFDDPRPGS